MTRGLKVTVILLRALSPFEHLRVAAIAHRYLNNVYAIKLAA